MEHLLLSNGVVMPQVGLGTYTLKDQTLESVVLRAAEDGYSMFDTASRYGNEEALGHELKTTLLPREKLFITTKLYVLDIYRFYHPRYHIMWRNKTVEDAYDNSCSRLGVAQADLYLLHACWPPVLKKMWRGIEDLYLSGRVRAIGVANFGIPQLELLNQINPRVMPMVNQLECTPYFHNRPAIEKSRQLGMQVYATSPLGRGLVTEQLLAEPVLQTIASQVGRSPAQVVLRWVIQQRLGVLSRSKKTEKVSQNIQLFDFCLTKEQMQAISKLECNLSTSSGIVHYVP